MSLEINQLGETHSEFEVFRKETSQLVIPRVNGNGLFANQQLIKASSRKADKDRKTGKYTFLPQPLSYFLCSFAKASFGFVSWLLKSTSSYLISHPTHAAISLLLMIALFVVVATGTKLHEQLLLREISDFTIDEIISSSQFTRNYYSTNLNSFGSREFLRSGAPNWIQRESVRAVLFHARKEGLSLEHQAVLLATVEVESGFNPMARARTTTACGLFQFVKATGLQFGLSPENCMNPWLNARAGVAHYLKNYRDTVHRKVQHLSGVERAFRTFEFSYYLHHDGPNSSNPSSDVKATVLKGTHFLLRAHHALRQDALNSGLAPSFLQRFISNLVLISQAISSQVAEIFEVRQH
jgi:hypothetical protein